MLKTEIGPSHRLSTLLLAAHGAACTAVVAAQLPFWIMVALIASIGLACAASVRQYAMLRAPASVVALEIGVDGTIAARTRDGTWHACTVLYATFVFPWLTVINLREMRGRRSLRAVLVEDSLDADTFRRLRTRLRWGQRV